MPTCFAFTIDQLYILGVSIGLFLLGTIAINIAASWSKTGDDERAEIRRHWTFIGRCWAVITVVIIFWVGFNNASPAPTTIKAYEDPPVVEATPRSAIDEAIGTTVRPAVESGTESNLNVRVKR